MKEMRIILLLFLMNGFLCSASAQHENKYELLFQPLFGKNILSLNDAFYPLNNGDSIQINTLKFYISGIEFLEKGKTVWKEENSFHLLDAVANPSLKVLLNVPTSLNFTEVKFNIGVDSLTNVSGAMGGDLDPTKGMYWTWQSGYINFKIEGKSNLCKTRNNEFQFHIGGYENAFNSLQTIRFRTSNKNSINILLDLEKFFEAIDLTKQNHVMSPSLEAASLSKKIAQAFILQKK